MKKSVVLLVATVFATVSGCSETDPVSGSIATGDISSTLVSVSGCNPFASDIQPATDAREECFEYSYDGEDLLTIRHIDFALNCCAGEIEASVTIDGGEIVIIESEEPGSAPCDCLCLYVSEIEISGIPPGQYRVLFSDAYSGPDEVLGARLLLDLVPEGRVCAARTMYPW